MWVEKGQTNSVGKKRTGSCDHEMDLGGRVHAPSLSYRERKGGRVDPALPWSAHVKRGLERGRGRGLGLGLGLGLGRGMDARGHEPEGS